MANFKLAIDAGHYLGTAGKRLPKKLDPNQTREWTLNDRVADYLAEAAALYQGVELKRVDDPTGKKSISLAARCKAANTWGADLYLSVHHNAGINLGSGGGIVAYAYKEGTTAAKYRDAIYNACIAAGGLKGNRSDPTQAKGFYVLKHTNAPAVLMEYGFMDSTADAPVILTEAYAKAMGYATMEAIAKQAGLTQTPAQPEQPAQKPKTYNLALPLVQRGDRGDTVAAVQKLLAVDSDGIFGPATQAALLAFQRDRGLATDGLCGPATWAALLGL